MNRLNLQSKTILILGFFIITSVALNFGILRFLVFPSFVELEETQATQNLRRVEDALKAELDAMVATASDWSSWDDTYEFASDGNQQYATENLYLEAFQNLNMNAVYIYNQSGSMLYGAVFDFDAGEQAPTENFLLSTLPPSHYLLRHSNTESMYSGLVRTSYGPMLLVSRPILNNQGQGPIRGTFVMGRFLNASLVEALRVQTHVDFRIWPLDGSSLPAPERDARAQIEDGQRVLLHSPEEGLLSAYAIVRDFANAPAVLLRADTPRDITAIGVDTLNVALAGLFLAGTVVLIVMALLMRLLVVGPVLGLVRHVLEIGRSNDLARRVASPRDDEIGLLGREFDHMLERLQDAQRRLVEQSFKSGLAEMAAGVLHNVRNQVTPMVLRVGRLKRTLVAPAADKIDKALSELARADTAPERRAKFAEYVRLSIDNLVARQTAAGEQLEAISQEVTKLDATLEEHNEVAYGGHLVEPISLSDVFDEVVQVTRNRVEKEVVVKVDPGIIRLEPVLAQKFLLKQVLVNLLTNAAESIQGSANDVGEVEIEADLDPGEGRKLVHIRVRDNGQGIDPAHLKAIFRRGFTTKAEGRNGLGLHWCANSIAGMNGRISAESQGLGHGAVLHVYLPAADSATSTAA
jgi:sensor domain CHASE-containing protein